VDWTPSIGDPTPLGWTVTLAYLLTAAICLQAARLSPQAEKNIWRCLALVLLALGINKELDLQSLLTDVARTLARSEGWYAYRRGVQTAFLIAIAIVIVAAAAGLIRLARGKRAGVLIGLTGMILLLGFILARAASFHLTDRLLRQEVAGLGWNGIFELAGIMLVAAGALLAGTRR
jgi:hypothetical protein